MERLFNSKPSKFDNAAILELADFLLKDGYYKTASGVDLPVDYNSIFPDNCEIVELEACEMLYFQSAPFEKEEEFDEAIKCVFEAIGQYKPEQYNDAYAYEKHLSSTLAHLPKWESKWESKWLYR